MLKYTSVWLVMSFSILDVVLQDVLQYFPKVILVILLWVLLEVLLEVCLEIVLEGLLEVFLERVLEDLHEAVLEAVLEVVLDGFFEIVLEFILSLKNNSMVPRFWISKPLKHAKYWFIGPMLYIKMKPVKSILWWICRILQYAFGFSQIIEFR